MKRRRESSQEGSDIASGSGVRVIRAAGGLIFKSVENEHWVLLIKRNRIWDLPKGKCEDGESDAHCALREVEEETGASGLELVEHLCDTWHEYTEKGEKVGKTTVWYLMREDDEQESQYKPQEEEGISELKWVPLVKAATLVGYDNLKKVVREAENRLLR